MRNPKPFTYKGERLNIYDVMLKAKVPCTKPRMYDRIRVFGIATAIECEDFEAMRREKLSKSYRPPSTAKTPEIPKLNVEQLWLDNLLASLKQEGVPEHEFAHEVKRRWAL